MSTILKNIVAFTGLVIGVPTSLPHQLNLNGLAVKPRMGGASAGGFTVTADATNVTVTRTAGAAVNAVHVYVEYWHTIEQALPGNGLVGLTPIFFFADGAGGGGGGGSHDPGTQAYFSGTGALTDDVNATMSLTDWQLSVASGGTQAVHIRRDISSVACGAASVASGNNSFASGDTCLASAVNAHAEGAGCTASGISSHAEGNACVASGNTGSHAEGTSCMATGTLGSHAEGIDCLASGTLGSHAEGNGCIASGASSHAQGVRALAARETQNAYASGRFVNNGDAQASKLIMRGSVAGGAPQTVELAYGSGGAQVLTLENSSGATVLVTAVAVNTADTLVQSFKQLLSLRLAVGATVIAAAGVQEQIGDAGASTWTLIASIDVAPDRLVLTFSNAATNEAVRVVAMVEFVQALS